MRLTRVRYAEHGYGAACDRGAGPEVVVAWGTTPRFTKEAVTKTGVYIVSRMRDADALPEHRPASISDEAISTLLDACPGLTMDDVRPTPGALAARIAAFWAPDEPVLYIGKADVPLATRVGQ